MTMRTLSAALAVALVVALPLDAAFAGRGGGGGGGGGGHGGFGGGGNRGVSDGGRGGISYSRPQNPSQQRLFDQARKECSGSQYASGATPRIDYASNSFNCVESGSSRR